MLFGVEELKNSFQLVVISATALDEAEDDAGVLAAAEDEEEELELLEQADIAVTRARPSAGTR